MAHFVVTNMSDVIELTCQLWPTLLLVLVRCKRQSKDGVTTRRPAPKPNEFYKVSLCKHFLQGECPFGEGCHFAHGEAELRKFPRRRSWRRWKVSEEISENMFSNQESTTVDYFQGGAAGGGRPTPILEPEQASFFILRAARQRDLAISTVKGEWYVQKKHAEQLNKAYQDGKKQVMLFFTVSDSNHIQGAALMTSKATLDESLPTTRMLFATRLGVEWYRTTELLSTLL